MINNVDWELFKLLTNVIVSGVTIWFSVRTIIEKYFVVQNQKNDLFEQRFLGFEKRLGKLETKVDEISNESLTEFREINIALSNMRQMQDENALRYEETHTLLESMNKNFLQVIDLLTIKKDDR